MTFLARTRSSSGKFEEIVFEAADRVAAFSELKRRNISVLSLAECGRDGRDGRDGGRVDGRKSGKPRGTFARGALAALLVVLGALAVWYFVFFRRGYVSVRMSGGGGSGTVTVTPVR